MDHRLLQPLMHHLNSMAHHHENYCMGVGTLGQNMAHCTFCRHCFHILRYPWSLWYTSCHKARNWKLQLKQNYNNMVHLMLAGMENLDPDTPAAKLAGASVEVAAMA